VEAASSDLGARLAVDRQGAIGEIYAALGTTVLSYLQRLVGRDDAEDVLQRVFYEVWRHNGRYDPSRSLTGWVLGIARNRAIDHLRRQRNTAVALETLDDIPGEDGRELAERYARSHEVRSALIRLPEEQREVLVLAYFGGYTQSQIATYLDLPLGPLKRERSGACAASPNSLSSSTRARPGIAAAAPFEMRMIRRQADGRAENKIRCGSEG
jgi:RNA polymerase sigma-70 factor (ECF subfamily)